MLSASACIPWRDSLWENDDRGIEVPNISRSVWCRVFEPGGEVPVGYAIFAADGSAVQCDDVHVDDAHRRRGIADQLYQLAACLFDAPVVPSQRLLDEGVLF